MALLFLHRQVRSADRTFLNLWLAAALGLAGCASNEGRTRPTPAAMPAFVVSGRGLTFPCPSDPAHKAYLGLPNDCRSFEFEQVKADILIVDVFDMYCRVCQYSVPTVNEFYRALRQSDLRDRVKPVGVGLGDSEMEVDLYRQRFKAPFPLLPDPDRKAGKTFQVSKTPTVLVLQRGADGQFQIIERHLGQFRKRHITEMLELVRSRLGKASKKH